MLSFRKNPQLNASLSLEAPPLENDDHFWQRRFYDFNIWTERKETEKLNYMHHNPVKRGLVSKPDQWVCLVTCEDPHSSQNRA